MAEQLWGHRLWELAKMDVSEVTFLQFRSLFGAPVYQPLLHQTEERFMRDAVKHGYCFPFHSPLAGRKKIIHVQISSVGNLRTLFSLSQKVNQCMSSVIGS